MRVLMVSHSAVAGGSNAVVASLLRHAPAGVEARWVFLEEGPWTARSPVPWAVVDTGRARHPWRAPGAVRRLRAAIREFEPDVVFGHLTKAHLYAAPAAALERVPYLWWQHEERRQKPVLHEVCARIPAAAVVCYARFTAHEQRRRVPHTPVVRIPGGVAVDGLGPPRAHATPTEPVLGVVGRLQRWKRVELALRAMPEVLRAVPGARLRVVGDAAPNVDPDYPEELRTLAADLGVAAAVDFAGHVEDGAAEMASLDVLVHCARREPFGLVPLEAMVRGVPVVVPAEGGPAETVRHGVDGLQVEVTDAAALARAVVELAADPGRRATMGAAGRERVLAEFTEERMAARAWRLVEAVAQRRPVADEL